MASMNEIEVSHALLQKARLISRAAWGAQLPTGKDKKLEGIISHVIFTYTDNEPCQSREDCVEAVRGMQQYHMAQGKFDIPYSFILGGDGNTYVGRGWTRAPVVPPEHEDNRLRTLVFSRIGPLTGGYTKDFEQAQYIIRFSQRERLTTHKLEVERYIQDWNTY